MKEPCRLFVEPQEFEKKFGISRKTYRSRGGRARFCIGDIPCAKQIKAEWLSPCKVHLVQIVPPPD